MFIGLHNNFLYQEEEEEEGGEEGEEGEEEGGEEVGEEGRGGEGEGEEETEPPSNQTESPSSWCQTADNEISCRGISMTHLSMIHNLEATNLDMAGVCVRVCMYACEYPG